MTVLLEACVDDVAAATRAGEIGADRLELCANLDSGGTTPVSQTITGTRRASGVPLYVMIRPRPGDFQYTGDELGRMLRDIARARKLGAGGVVLGALDRTARLDREALARLLAAARPMAVTFHRAFDQVQDQLEALDTLCALGVERVLTSGQAITAEAGIPRLKLLVARAAGRIGILAGGGIRAQNVARIVAETGVREIHLRAGPGAEWLSGVVRALRRR